MRHVSVGALSNYHLLWCGPPGAALRALGLVRLLAVEQALAATVGAPTSRFGLSGVHQNQRRQQEEVLHCLDDALCPAAFDRCSG
jgi:hypothetical protein